jgi:hypothetical protein
MDLNLCKEFYFFEIKRNEEMGGRLNLPFTVLSILGGIVAYIVQNFYFEMGWLSVIFGLFIFLATGSIIISIYYLIRSYHGYIYEYLPTVFDLNEYHTSLKNYYRGDTFDEKIKEEFSSFLKDNLIKATLKNTWNNDKKSAFFHDANKFLICAFILTLLGSIVYFYNYFIKPDKPQKIELTNY